MKFATIRGGEPCILVSYPSVVIQRRDDAVAVCEHNGVRVVVGVVAVVAVAVSQYVVLPGIFLFPYNDKGLLVIRVAY